jgi:hypothetical protein
MTIFSELRRRYRRLPVSLQVTLAASASVLLFGIILLPVVSQFLPPAQHLTDTPTPSATSQAPSPLLFGTNLSLMDEHDQVLTSAPTRALLQQLHPRSIRMPLHTGLPESIEIQAAQVIKQLGAMPIVNLRGALDVDALTDDRQVIQDMNKVFGNETVYYEYGNEDDLLGVSADRYTTSWNAIVPLLKVLAPNGRFVGPVTYHYDSGYLKTFLQRAQPLPDAVSWHEYTCTRADSQATCLAGIADWSKHISNARSVMQAVIGKELPIMITEWSYAPDAQANDGKSNDTAFMSTWTQKAFQTLVANHVFAAMQYSCTNSATALVSSKGTLTAEGAVFMAQYQQATTAQTLAVSTPVSNQATATTDASSNGPTIQANTNGPTPTPTTPVIGSQGSTTGTSSEPTPSVPLPSSGPVTPVPTTSLPTPTPTPTPVPRATPVAPTPVPTTSLPTPTPTPVPPTPTPTPVPPTPTPTPVPPTPTPTPTPPPPPPCASHAWKLTLLNSSNGTTVFYTSPYCSGRIQITFTQPPPYSGAGVQVCLTSGACSSWVSYAGNNVWITVFSGVPAGTGFTINGRCTNSAGEFSMYGIVQY